MAPFAFNLQPLLEMRERTEDERKRTYAARIADHNASIAEVRRRFALRTEDLRVARARAQAEYNPRRNEDLRALVVFHTQRIFEAQTLMEQAQAVRDEARRHLQEATREKKTLEALKERRRLAYLEARELREQMEIDEVNVVRQNVKPDVDGEPADA